MNFGRYELIRKIAAGGMGEIFRARVNGLEGFEKPIALKRIFPHLSDNEAYRKLFVREAKVTARLIHPNIAQVYDLGESDGQLFIAMEYVAGVDLGRILEFLFRENQTLPVSIASVIAFDVLEALDFAHHLTDEQEQPLHVVHRDISPQNILIERSNGFVKICDFGVAQPMENTDFLAGHRVGKTAYIPPEQAMGDPVDGRADIYALGAVLFRAVTGRKVFDAGDAQTLIQQVMSAPIPRLRSVNPDLPPAFANAVDGALQRDPAQRFSTAAQFREAIEQFLVKDDPRRARKELCELVRAQDPTVVQQRPSERTPRTEAKGTKRWTQLVSRFSPAAVEDGSSARPADSNQTEPRSHSTESVTANELEIATSTSRPSSISEGTDGSDLAPNDVTAVSSFDTLAEPNVLDLESTEATHKGRKLTAMRFAALRYAHQRQGRRPWLGPLFLVFLAFGGIWGLVKAFDHDTEGAPKIQAPVKTQTFDQQKGPSGTAPAETRTESAPVVGSSSDSARPAPDARSPARAKTPLPRGLNKSRSVSAGNTPLVPTAPRPATEKAVSTAVPPPLPAIPA